MIEEALDTEDRAILERYGEQGVFAQMFSVYDGKMRWLAVMATVMTFAIFVGALYCAWMLVNASDTATAVRWGVGTVAFMAMVGFLKIWFWLRMESNRILREVKRVELQVARLNTK
jgi:hypothetical protein